MFDTMNPAGFPHFSDQFCSFIVVVVGGVATWHGHIMMLHVMVVMYDHFQGTKMANLSCGA